MVKKVFLILFLLFFSVQLFAANPVVTSDTHPNGEWSNSPFIKVNISYSDATRFAYLVNTEESTEVDISGGDSDVTETTESELNLGSKKDGIYWLHVKAKNSSDWSETTNFEIKIDENGPVRAENLTAVAEGTKINIAWEEAVDDLSGIAYYNLYRSNLWFVKDGEISRQFRVRDIVAKKIGSELIGTSFEDKNITEGYRYHYKIQAIDNAGNIGLESTVASVRANSFCDNEINLVAEKLNDFIKITIDSDKKFKKGYLVVTEPTGKETVLVDSNLVGYSFEGSFSLANKTNGDYNIFFSSIDDDQDFCFVQTIFVFDTVPPEVKILKPIFSELLKETVKFEISAKDTGTNFSGIGKVEIYYEKDDKVLLGEASEENGKYVFEWESSLVSNGRYKIIAKAIDRGGNSTEDYVLYSIENLAKIRDESKEKIDLAESKRLEVNAFFEKVKKQSINISELEEELVLIDSNLLYAKGLFEKGQHYNLISTQADVAKTKYSSLLQKLSLVEYKKLNYVYNTENLDLFLKATGLESGITGNAKQLIEELKPTRKLSISKIVFNGETFYRANIIISLSNASDKNIVVKAIEVIPKKFSDSANKILSYNKFEILQNDPIIAFDSINLLAGETKEMTYSIEQKLTKEQADLLISSNVINFFVSPPIVVDSSIDLSSVKLSALLNVSAFLSFIPQIEWNTTSLVIVGVAIVAILFILLIIVLIIVFAFYYFFIKKRRNHHGFG